MKRDAVYAADDVEARAAQSRTEGKPVGPVPTDDVGGNNARRPGKVAAKINIVAVAFDGFQQPLNPDPHPVGAVPTRRINRRRVVGIGKDATHIQITIVRHRANGYRAVAEQTAIQLKPVRPVETRHGVRLGITCRVDVAVHINLVADDGDAVGIALAVYTRRAELIIPMLIVRDRSDGCQWQE